MDRTQLKRSIRWEAVIIVDARHRRSGIFLALVLGWALMKALEPSGLTVVPGPGRRARRCCSSVARSSARWRPSSRRAGPPSCRSSTPSPTSSALAVRTPVRIACGRSVFTEIEAHRDVTWQPSLLAIDEPDFDPDARRRPAAVPRPGCVGRRRAGLGHRRRRAVRHGARVGAVEGLRATDVRPGRRRAAPRDAASGTTGPRCSTAWPGASAGATASGCPSISANLYRDGNDSVAWHGDRIGRRAGRRGRRDPVARVRRARCCCVPTAAARRSRSRCTPATCSCRAAPASAPSSTASPSAPTPARGSA